MEYRIRIEEGLGDEAAAWLGCSVVARGPGGETLLACAVADQAALFGLLRRLRDAGVTLVSMERVDGR
jgi:hypothetical protein